MPRSTSAGAADPAADASTNASAEASTDPPADASTADADLGGGHPGRRFGTAALALAVAVGLLLGYAAGLLTPRLTQPGDGSAEAGFARDMIVHHAQAVEMGLIAFQHSTDHDVQQIAVDIATAQQGEIGMMHAWLKDWRLDPTGSQPAMTWMPEGMRKTSGNGPMPGMANAEEITQLRGATGRELDILFVQLMIRHHLGGVHMIDAMLAAGGEPAVVEAAQTMKNVQRSEMANLNQLLTRLGGTPLPAD